MKLIKTVGLMFELTDEEFKKLEVIAGRDGTTPEKALKKAIDLFLRQGVQTPKSGRKSRAA